MRYEAPVPRLLVICMLMGPCSKRADELRGFHDPTPDGGTMLSVEDCAGPAWIDGRKVKPKTPVPVKPGSHAVGCGDTWDKDTAMEIDVPKGRTYHFDYWGP